MRNSEYCKKGSMFVLFFCERFIDYLNFEYVAADFSFYYLWPIVCQSLTFLKPDKLEANFLLFLDTLRKRPTVILKRKLSNFSFPPPIPLL